MDSGIKLMVKKNIKGISVLESLVCLVIIGIALLRCFNFHLFQLMQWIDL